MIDTCPFTIPEPETVNTMPGLLYFIWEREAIRIARENGHPAPWTRDPVLGKYKFTNIRRRDDRVSKWIAEHIIKPNEHRKDLWFILLITRLINWPPTLRFLIDEGILFRSADDFESKKFSAALEQCKSLGAKVYSGAYMVYPTKMDPGGVKSLAIAQHIIAPALSLKNEINLELFSGTPLISKFVETLSRGFGISTFMAGQVAADLTYANEGQLSRASDLYTYAPIGPGSSRGLNYLLNRAPNAGWAQDSFNAELMKIRNMVIDKLQTDDLTLHDVQNCMCEFSKYCRTVIGDGVPKTTYKPEMEF